MSKRFCLFANFFLVVTCCAVMFSLSSTANAYKMTPWGELQPEDEDDEEELGAVEVFEPGDQKKIVVNGVEFAFRWCPPGKFMMGSPESEKKEVQNSLPDIDSKDVKFFSDRRFSASKRTIGIGVQKGTSLNYGRSNNEPQGKREYGSDLKNKMLDQELEDLERETQHQVTLTKGFWIMETEVTQKQWNAIMNINPSENKGDYLPVENVSWEDCQRFCKKCQILGFDFRLPSEAQWEYACRAENKGRYSGNLDAMAWYRKHDDYRDRNTQTVGTKTTNAWGIYDMHGNVQEWCEDCFRGYPCFSVTDPLESSSGPTRVVRGGCVRLSKWYCRSASRDNLSPDQSSPYIGFRCIMTNEQ